MAEAETSKENKKMNRKTIASILALAVALLWSVTGASAASAAQFGLAPGAVDGTVLGEDGQAFSQAGAHPFHHHDGDGILGSV